MENAGMQGARKYLGPNSGARKWGSQHTAVKFTVSTHTSPNLPTPSTHSFQHSTAAVKRKKARKTQWQGDYTTSQITLLFCIIS